MNLSHLSNKQNPLLEGMKVNIGTLAGTMVGRIGGGWLMPSGTVVGMIVVVIKKRKEMGMRYHKWTVREERMIAEAYEAGESMVVVANRLQLPYRLVRGRVPYMIRQGRLEKRKKVKRLLPERNKLSWSKEEVRLLLKIYRSGYPWRAKAAEAIGRSMTSCGWKLRMLKQLGKVKPIKTKRK